MLLFAQHVKRNEYIGENGKGKTKLRDRVYRQHIKQPEYRMLKVEQHLSGKNNFYIFLFFQLKTNNKIYREYEKHSREHFRPYLH